MNKKVVLAISGSLRKPSFTEKMLDLCIDQIYQSYLNTSRTNNLISL